MNKATSRLAARYDWAKTEVLSRLSHPLLLAFRLYFGYQFFLAGKGKLENIARVAMFFDSIGIPAPVLNAWFVGGLECVGGILLMAGLGSRIIAVPLSINMMVAYLTVDARAVQMLFVDPSLFLSAEPFMYLLTSLLVVAFGPGAFSVDALIRSRVVESPKDEEDMSGAVAA